CQGEAARGDRGLQGHAARLVSTGLSGLQPGSGGEGLEPPVGAVQGGVGIREYPARAHSSARRHYRLLPSTFLTFRASISMPSRQRTLTAARRAPVFGFFPTANDWIPQVEQNLCWMTCLLNS